MAYLIADSGSTKTEWCLVSSSQKKTVFTEGLNPYYHTAQTLTEVLKGNLMPQIGEASVDSIYFYGAGCDEEKRNRTIYEVLDRCFSGAEIEIEHDLLAAARACFFDEPGIACILGTGSNSCLYDGQEIVEHIPSLAFILGDEGSAAYFGKKIINRYFRDELPATLKKDLEESYNVSLPYIMQKAYKESQPSRFIASYGTFLGAHKDHPYIEEMLRKGFQDFISRIVKKYNGASSHKVSFVGSVACAHEQIIKKVLLEEGLTCGSFTDNILERLVAYHVS